MAPLPVEPSNPLYAASYAPFRNTASTLEMSRFGWNSAPAESATQCTGQVAAKSGWDEKCEPGST